MRRRCGSWGLGLALILSAGLALLAGCRRDGDAAADARPTGAERPVQAVQLLTRHLRDNDLAAFARDAVPPALHARLDTAWRAGRTRWPLDELPFGERVPQIVSVLAAPGADRKLAQVFDRQFAHADGELRSTAATLGLFGAQYLRNEGDFSDSERDHYAQVIAAAGRWGQSAPLSDPARARAALAALTAAARTSGLLGERDFAHRGMHDSLRRLTPLLAALKQALTGYGLDLDADLAAMEVRLDTQTGDTARVRMRYRLAGTAIDALVPVERRDGRWYVSDFVREAEAAAAAKAAPPPAPPAKP